MIRFLHEHRNDAVSSSPVNQLSASNDSVGAQSSETELSHSRTSIDRIIYRWMIMAASVRMDPREYGDHVECIVAFSRSCLETKQNEMCRSVLDKILDMPGDETEKLLSLQIPTIRGLCPLLQEFLSPAYSPLFSHFFREVIERYCRLKLGSRTYSPQLESLLCSIEKKFYCKCHDCAKLKAFMKQIYVPQKTFLVSRKGYSHFQRQIWSADDLADVEEVHSPYKPNPYGPCIKVIKSHIFEEQRWETRIKEFREFLSVIGEEEVIAKVMGDRYTNLKEAMEG